MRAATLFSGIGAPEVAKPDWAWQWHAEIDKFPSAVMAARHPSSVNLGDVTAHDFIERAIAAGRPEVLVFGSPCQSFSVAGRRLGLDDPRGNLALVALGIVARTQPTWFVFENVPGLLSSDEGRDWGLFNRAVDELGYHLCWRMLDAQYAGLAQRRLRLFAVGHARDWRRAAAVLLEPESLCGHPPTRQDAGQDVTGTLSSRPSAGGGLGTDFDLDGGLVGTMRSHHGNPQAEWAWTGQLVSSSGERARALTTSNQRIDYETETLIAHTLRGEGFDAMEDGTGRGTPLVPVLAQTLTTGGEGARGRIDSVNETLVPIAFTMKDHGADAGEISPTLRSGGHDQSHANGGVPPAVAFDWQSGGSKQRTRTRTRTSALSANQTPAVMASGVRRLTPRECERLQGFPDDYTLIDYRGKLAKDGPRYKAIGNSMAVPVVRWILDRIEFVHGL